MKKSPTRYKGREEHEYDQKEDHLYGSCAAGAPRGQPVLDTRGRRSGAGQESCLCTQRVHREREMFLFEGQDTCPGPVSERLWPLDRLCCRELGACCSPP